jgi:hypothetical protein
MNFLILSPVRYSNRIFSEAAGESKPEAYHSSPAHPRAAKKARLPKGYVEDFVDPRTKLKAGFSIPN